MTMNPYVDPTARHESGHVFLAYASGFPITHVQIEPEAYTDVRFPFTPLWLGLRYVRHGRRALVCVVQTLAVLQVGSHCDGRTRPTGHDQEQITLWHAAVDTLQLPYASGFHALEKVARDGMRHWAREPSVGEAIEWLAVVLERQRTLSGAQLNTYITEFLGEGRALPKPVYRLPAAPTPPEPVPALRIC
jgi:hypothetical protein